MLVSGISGVTVTLEPLNVWFDHWIHDTLRVAIFVLNNVQRLTLKKSENMEKHTVHWFRKGLRLHDNPSLHEGLKNSTTFRCIYIIDPWFAGSSNVGTNIWRYGVFYIDNYQLLLRICRKTDHFLCVPSGDQTKVYNVEMKAKRCVE